jgi:hypothetical protein
MERTILNIVKLEREKMSLILQFAPEADPEKLAVFTTVVSKTLNIPLVEATEEVIVEYLEDLIITQFNYFNRQEKVDAAVDEAKAENKLTNKQIKAKKS